MPKSKGRGFASMDPVKQRNIASNIGGFDFSIFSTALIVTTLIIILKRKIAKFHKIPINPQQPVLLLPERSTMALGV